MLRITWSGVRSGAISAALSGITLALAGCSQGTVPRTEPEAAEPSESPLNAETNGTTSDGTDEAAVFVEPSLPASFLRGFNLGNRLDAPTEGDWGPRLNAETFTAIAARGFDHVRMPVRFSGHALAAAPYTLEEAFMLRVDWALAQALKNDLSVVLDLQYYDELMSAPDAERERFLALWEQIALRYQSLPAHVAFELLNEPDGEVGNEYNTLAEDAIRAIRTTNPDRRVIVDSVDAASPETLSVLELPEDANLVASVHLYAPLLFTLQGVPWLGPEFATTGVLFPGPPDTPLQPVAAALDLDWAKAWFEQYNTLPAADNPSGPAAVAASMDAIIAFRERTGHDVYVGEFGTSSFGDEDSRVHFLTALREGCEAAGIGWAVWDNNGADMALLDPATRTWQEPLVEALIPTPD